MDHAPMPESSPDDAWLRNQIQLPQFPRAARYDPRWQLDLSMGPNSLWLVDFLTGAMTLAPGMRVLDLGCGRGGSSVFLAKEHHVQVWAADLWIDPTENRRTFEQAGVADQVLPLRVEAHQLPFAHEFFDAVICVDAYTYFGTDDLYLGYLADYLRPGGQLGAVMPGVVQELDGKIPEHLKDCWEWEYHAFHSPSWWARHWAKTGKVAVEVADLLTEGWRSWQRWEEVVAQAGKEHWSDHARTFAAALARDAGRTLGIVRTVARKPPTDPPSPD
jgi:cyclopropane fatty-acyl-phospholipid synthase-like methyltransferase